MNNLRVWIYLGVIAIYLILRTQKGKKKPASNQQQKPTTASPWVAPRPVQKPDIFQSVVKKIEENRNRLLQSQKQAPLTQQKVAEKLVFRKPVSEMAENKPILPPFNESPAVLLKDYGLISGKR